MAYKVYIQCASYINVLSVVVVVGLNRPEGAGSKASSLHQPDHPLCEAIFWPLVTSRRNWRAWEGVVYSDLCVCVATLSRILTTVGDTSGWSLSAGEPKEGGDLTRATSGVVK